MRKHTWRTVTAATAALVVAGGVMASVAPTASAGSTGVLWSAGQETGSLSEWGNGGGQFNSGTGSSSAEHGVAHSGGWGLKSTLSDGNGGTRMFRWKEPRANRSLYYSAYLYIPRTYRLSGAYHHWNVMQFKSVSSSGRNDPLWAFEVGQDATGNLRIHPAWGYGGTQIAGPRATDNVSAKTFGWFSQPLPIGRWIHLEAYLSESSRFDGHITFWQDGRQMFDMANVRTSYANCAYNSWCAENEWSINLYSDGISPAPAQVYFDDAAIGTQPINLSGATSPSSPTSSPTVPKAAPRPRGTGVIWSATAETRNLSQWNRGGGQFNSGSGSSTAVKGIAHSGSWSIGSTLRNGNGGTRLFRWKELRSHRTLYYSVWLYIPRRYRLTGAHHHWNVMQFKSVSSRGRNDPVWAFEVGKDSAGRLRIHPAWGYGGTRVAGPRAADRVAGKTLRWFSKPLPIRRWVHLEARLTESSGFTGRITFWQNGQRMFDMANIRTSYRNCTYNSWCAENEWSINLYSDGMWPHPARVYFDDAKISTRPI